jgi:hypothetical protein
VAVLEPFEGYWVKNLTDEPVTLRIPPTETPPVPAEIQHARPAVASAHPAGDEIWRLEIRASCRGIFDLGNYAGMLPGAELEWDKHDRSEPPMNPGRAIALYFPHRSWRRYAGSYTCDFRGRYEAIDTRGTGIRAADGECWGHAWRFDVAKSFVEHGVADEVRLEVVGLEETPVESQAYLIDRHLGQVIDLRDVNRYTFHSGCRATVSEEEARFILLVGSEEFLGRHGAELPARTALHQNYPNPFSCSTIIRYDLTRGDAVSLRIYDATGAVVKSLCDGPRNPGCYEAVWLGDTENGNRAAAGIYFCRLRTAAGFDRTRKLLLVR